MDIFAQGHQNRIYNVFQMTSTFFSFLHQIQVLYSFRANRKKGACRLGKDVRICQYITKHCDGCRLTELIFRFCCSEWSHEILSKPFWSSHWKEQMCTSLFFGFECSVQVVQMRHRDSHVREILPSVWDLMDRIYCNFIFSNIVFMSKG